MISVSLSDVFSTQPLEEAVVLKLVQNAQAGEAATSTSTSPDWAEVTSASVAYLAASPVGDVAPPYVILDPGAAGSLDLISGDPFGCNLGDGRSRLAGALASGLTDLMVLCDTRRAQFALTDPGPCTLPEVIPSDLGFLLTRELRRLEPVSWFISLDRLCEQSLDESIDVVFDAFIPLMESSHLAECDALLGALSQWRISAYPLEVTLAFLSITVPAAAALPSRPALFERVRAHVLKTRPDDVDALLAGLE